MKIHATGNYVFIKPIKAFTETASGIEIPDQVAPFSGGKVVSASEKYSCKKDGVKSALQEGDYVLGPFTEEYIERSLMERIGPDLVSSPQPYFLAHSNEMSIFKNIMSARADGGRALVRYKKAAFAKSNIGLITKEAELRQDKKIVELVSVSPEWVSRMYQDPTEFAAGCEYLVGHNPSVSVLGAFPDDNGQEWIFATVNITDLMAKKTETGWVPIGEFVVCIEISETHIKREEDGLAFWEPRKKTGAFQLDIPGIDRSDILAPYSVVAMTGGGITEDFEAHSWTRQTNWVFGGRKLAPGDVIVHGKIFKGSDEFLDSTGKVIKFDMNGEQDQFLIDNAKWSGVILKDDFDFSFLTPGERAKWNL